MDQPRPARDALYHLLHEAELGQAFFGEALVARSFGDMVLSKRSILFFS